MNINHAHGQICKLKKSLHLKAKRWKERWELHPTDQVKPFHLCTTKTCIRISIEKLLTMLPSTLTAERSFSVLKRVKTYIYGTGKIISQCNISSHREPALDKQKCINDNCAGVILFLCI
jgi:hypothetical protein